MPADATFRFPGFAYQHSYHFASPKLLRCFTVRVISQLPEASSRAVAVASDEARRQGIHPWKRQRLIRAGADLVIGDYRDNEHLLRFLFAEE